MSQPINEADLHASIDTAQPDADKAAVEAWLRTHPQDAARIADYQRQNAALREAYDPVLAEPVPAHLTAMLEARPARAGWMRHAAAIAALALGAVIGGIGGWAAHGWQAARIEAALVAPAFARQAAISHVVYTPEVRHPVEVGADQEQHLVEWLSKRLNATLRIPHLGAEGYALVGGRLLPGQPENRSPVAQFMYQNDAKKRLTLYVRVDSNDGANAASPSNETAFRFAQEKNVGVFYWVDEKFGYALSGDIDKADLLRVANAVYRQLQSPR